MNLSGPVVWPLFLAMFKANGIALSRKQLADLPGERQAARRTAKGRMNEKLKDLDVVIPDSEWRLVDASEA